MHNDEGKSGYEEGGCFVWLYLTAEREGGAVSPRTLTPP